MPTTNGTNGDTDRLARFQELVANALMARKEFFNRFMDPRRSINDECGYPSGWVGPQIYQELYEREAIAARVVQVMPKESWQVQPLVYEKEDTEVATEFEKAWDELGNQQWGTDSHYASEEGSPIWEYLKRADELSGIGQYGVVLLGLDDGKELREPAAPQKGQKLTFLRCFPESLSQITQMDPDVKSPRFGQPVEYLLTFSDPREAQGGFGGGFIGGGILGTATATMNVHWTRVIHLADNLGSSEVFGVPRMRPVLNRLLDLVKLYGGSAEMYWRGAFPGLSFETNPALGGDVILDQNEMRNMAENYMNGLQRYLSLTGMTAKSLAPQVVDPTPQINTQIEAICIQLAIPKRVFMGSERGELSSSQDESTWNDRLKQRQNGYITPRVIVPFVDRLIMLGILPEPESYYVEWPDLASQSESEKATVAATKTQALAQYVSGSVESVLPPMDYLTRIMDFSEEEAAAILDNAAKAMEEQDQLKMDKQKDMIDQGLAPDPTKPQMPPPGQPGQGPPQPGKPFQKQDVASDNPYQGGA